MQDYMPSSETEPFGGLPQPDAIPEKHRTEAAAAYIMMFSGMYFPVPLIEIVMSLIYYNYWKRESRFHAFHSYQAMVSQLPISILNYGFLAWVIVLIVRAVREASGTGADGAALWGYFSGGLFLIAFWCVVGLNLIYIILSLVAYKKASKGRFFYLPFFGRVSYDRFFGPHAVAFKGKPQKEASNLPPGSAARG
jgi:uncharacterized membrane protein